MDVSLARRIAYDILLRVEAEQAYAGELLYARLNDPAARIKSEDAALTTELVLGLLRWQRQLDFLIERQTGRSVGQLDLEVLLALRLGLYQLRFLTRVPSSAAVNESVELVKRARKRSAAALVNAVLRHAPSGPVETLLPATLPAAARLGILHSHTDWMIERWLARFGEAQTLALLEANNRPPRLACAILDESRREQILRELEQKRMQPEPGRWLKSALTLRGGNPAITEAFRRGWISIQDEASQIVPHLLDVRPGQRVLDLCAAPGGKTALLARAAGEAGRVVAGDVHAHRLRAMTATLKRLGAGGVQCIVLDGTSPLPFLAVFDRILVDAPCSGTGTLARNPEIRWRLKLEDLDDLHRRQFALLANALGVLAPGGKLVYSTCSLEAEENEQVVDGVLHNREDVRPVSGLQAIQPHLREGVHAAEFIGQNGVFRTMPGQHGTDGFFAVVMESRR